MVMSTFITDTDYQLVTNPKTLEAISQVSADIRSMAETEAIEELSGYLRARYDVATIFAAEGDDRNPQLVMYGCDIALYHMSASLPQRIGSEIREERYKAAIAWLEKVANGDVTPDLPTTDTSSTSVGAFVIQSQTQLHNNW